MLLMIVFIGLYIISKTITKKIIEQIIKDDEEINGTLDCTDYAFFNDEEENECDN